MSFSLIKLRNKLGLRQSEMAERMGLSLRPYQAVESTTKDIRPRHVRLAEYVALDLAIESEDLSLLPDNVLKKANRLAFIIVQQNLKKWPLEIAKSILRERSGGKIKPG